MSKMSKHKLNKLLQETVYSIHVPDVKDKAKQVPINVTETKNVAKSRSNKKIAIACAFACCIAIICTCIGIFVPGNEKQISAPVVNETSYITIDINPSFTITLKDDKVTSLSNNNKDGGIVLAGINNEEIIGKDLKTVVNRVLKEATISGYLVYDNELEEKSKNAVKIGVMNDEGLNLESLLTEVEKDVKDFFVSNNMFALILKDSFAVKANENIMNQYGITFAKYELIKSLYREKYKPIFIDEKSKQFKDFVNEYKDKRVSEINNEMMELTSDILKDIYSTIHEILAPSFKIEDFEQFIETNKNIVNTKLDEFINSKLKELTESELIDHIISIDKELKNKLDDLINKTETKSTIVSELIKKYEYEDFKSEFETIIKWFTIQQDTDFDIF